MNEKQETSVRDANGNLIEYEEKTWDWVTNSWSGVSHYTYAYNGNGKRTEEISQFQNPLTNSYDNFLRILYTYDNNGKLIKEIIQKNIIMV